MLHSEGKKPRQTFCQSLAISQGVTRKLVVYTTQLYPFLNKTNEAIVWAVLVVFSEHVVAMAAKRG